MRWASSPAGGSLRIGDPANGEIPPVHVSWNDIVGSDGAAPGTRMGAGRVLSMLDACAARASQIAADHAAAATKQRFLCCTVGVTNTLFSSPVLHGDTVRLDGRVVHCGSSSIAVYIRMFRGSYSSRKEIAAGESFFTMVTITPDLKAAHIVPSINLTDPLDIEMHHRYLQIRKITKEYTTRMNERQNNKLTHEEVNCPINIEKPMHIHMSDTKIEAHRIFFSSYLNNNNTVFGGELMKWMESHAVHCGRSFTKNHHVYCIGMHSVAFPEPVFATDWVKLEAKVIYVRNTTMEVDVTLRAERATGGVVTNRASFVLNNSNDIGVSTDIPVGIVLDKDTSQEDLKDFMDAKARYHGYVQRMAEWKKNHPSRSEAAARQSCEK